MFLDYYASNLFQNVVSLFFFGGSGWVGGGGGGGGGGGIFSLYWLN